MAYLTIEEVKDRLRIDESFAETDLARMIVEAEDIVRDYLKREIPYTETDVPERVKTATLLVIAALYDSSGNPLSSAVKSILHRTRTPTIA